MHSDLETLYRLAVGTLLVGAAMTLWERKVRPERGRALAAWAGGYLALALGCLTATYRDLVPGGYGTALSSILILSGYLLMLEGIAALNGRRYRACSAAIVALLSALWLTADGHWREWLWNYIAAFLVALACGAAAWEMARSKQLRGLRSRQVIIMVMGLYALLYAARAFVLPVLTMVYGKPLLAQIGSITIYAGVLYSTIMPMALLALIREDAHDQLLKLSLTDHLTGLGNRRWFFEQSTPLCRTAAKPLSLLAFDMDHFKAINDLHGHAAGDEVLKGFARVARTIVGPGAILARIGGEEFAALLPDCDGNRAQRIGQAVVQRFASTIALTASGTPVRATVSVGLAELGIEGNDLTGLLCAADRALYCAKALGRNRIETAAA